MDRSDDNEDTDSENDIDTENEEFEKDQNLVVILSALGYTHYILDY